MLLEGIKMLCNVLQSFLSYSSPMDAAPTFPKYCKEPQFIARAMPQSSVRSISVPSKVLTNCLYHPKEKKKVKIFPPSYKNGSYASELSSCSLAWFPMFPLSVSVLLKEPWNQVDVP